MSTDKTRPPLGPSATARRAVELLRIQELEKRRQIAAAFTADHAARGTQATKLSKAEYAQLKADLSRALRGLASKAR